MIKWKKFGYQPITLRSDGWYFFDETWSNLCGPYPNHIEAAAEVLQYAEELEKWRPVNDL